MKHKFLYAALTAALLAAPVFTACSGDDDDTEQKDKDQFEVASQEIKYTVTVKETGLVGLPITNVADLYVNYVENGDGNVHQVPITNGKAEVYIKQTKFPYSIKLYTTMAPKADANVDTGSNYSIDVSYTYGYTTTYKNGKKGGEIEPDHQSLGMSGDKVIDYLNRHGGEDRVRTYTFDPSGNYVSNK